MIDFSLNEAEMLAVKVARGIGYSWGLAEDVGRAARLLARRECNWAEALHALVQDGSAFAAPSLERISHWRRGESDIVASTPLCPIRTAAALADGVRLLQGMELRLRNVGMPIWLEAMLDAGTQRTFTLQPHPAATLRASDVTVATVTATATGAGPSASARRAQIDSETLAALLAVAARTYVPESARSRSRGAGGGRVDDE